MRILVLSKRQYTGKDLLDDQYGRIFEIPAQLSHLGHEVRGFALSYRPREERQYSWPQYPNLEWSSRNVLPHGLLIYNKALDSYLKEWMPDVVWASSDILHAVLAYRWTRKRKVPLILDLYDNYESFGASKIPGFKRCFINVCKYSEAVTTVSHSLRSLVHSEYGRKKPVHIVPNAVRKDLFHLRNKHRCRKVLELPEKAQIIGAAGAITADRGVEDLFNAFFHLAKRNSNLWLVYAGPKDKISRRYQHPKIIDLGTLDLDKVSILISSLDIAVVCNKDSSFGRYCFPLKLMEALAAKTPVIAANVGDVSSYLSLRQDCLYEPGNYKQLSEKIENHLCHYSYDNLPETPDWKTSSEKLIKIMAGIIKGMD